jgi:phage gpG-like protein
MATESFSIDTSDMQKAARDLAAAGEELRVVSPIALREGAQVAAAAARGLSSWSSRIPGSIHVNSAGETVLVRAGGANAPHASVFEHGGEPGMFHHPTYGHAPYVAQQARPFLAPAAVVGAETTERIALRETDRVLSSRNL